MRIVKRSSHQNSNEIVNSTRYNISFASPKQHKSINHGLKLMTSYSRSKTQTRISFDDSPKSQNKINKTYTKYSYFPVNSKRFKSSKNVQKHTTPEIKWIGVNTHKVDLQANEQSNLRNYFPQRKKKVDNQGLINLLYKYDRHFNNERSQIWNEMVKTGKGSIRPKQTNRYINKTKKNLFSKKNK